MIVRTLQEVIEDKCDYSIYVDTQDQRTGQPIRIPVAYEELLDCLLEEKASCFFDYDAGIVCCVKTSFFPPSHYERVQNASLHTIVQ